MAVYPGYLPACGGTPCFGGFQQQSPFGGGPVVQTQYRAASQYTVTQVSPFGGGGFVPQSPYGAGGLGFGGGFPQQSLYGQSPYGAGFGGQSPYGAGFGSPQFGAQGQGGPQLYGGNLWPVGPYSPQLGGQMYA